MIVLKNKALLNQHSVLIEKNGRQKGKQSYNKEIRHMGAGEEFSGTADTDESRFLASLNALRHQGMQKRRAEKTELRKVKTELRKVKKEAREKTKKEGRENKLREAIAEIFLREATKKFDISTAQIAALADDELSLLDAWLIQKSRHRKMASALMCVIPIFGWFIGFIDLSCRWNRSSRATKHYIFYRKKLDRGRKAPSFPFERIHRLTGNQKTPNAQKQDIAKTAINDTCAKTARTSRPASGALIGAGPHDLLAQKLHRLRAENEHKREETRKQSSQDHFVSCFLHAAAHYYFLDGARIAAMTDAQLEMLDALIIRRTRRIRALVRTAMIAGFPGIPIIGWFAGAIYFLRRRDYLLQNYIDPKPFPCRYKFFRRIFHEIHGANVFPHKRLRQCAANGFN